MIYKLKCKVTPKQPYTTRVKFDAIDIRVRIYKTKGFDYGNGKGLAIQVGDDTPDLIDIRYDMRYKDSEIEYVKTFVKEYAREHLIFTIADIAEVKIL